MDIDVSRWVVEFLLRKPLEGCIFDALFRSLPLSDVDLSLKRSILLRRLESEISTGLVSEKVLEFLEYIEELDSQDGVKSPDSMKAAYCAAAVECTVKFLELSEGDCAWEYFEAVKRIWRERVCKMEGYGLIGLVSAELLDWRDHMEAAVADSNVRDDVLAKSKNSDARLAIQAYLAEAREKMGPSFLELVADQMGDDSVKATLALGNDGMVDRVGEGTVNKSTTETQMGMRRRHKHAVSKRYRGSMLRTSGAKIADDEQCSLQHDLPSTPAVNDALQALEACSMELRAMTKDPLPDALNHAEIVRRGLERENAGPDHGENLDVVKDDASNTTVDNDAEIVKSSLERESAGHNQATETCNVGNEDAPNDPIGKNSESVCANECPNVPPNNTPVPSLMERNHTALTHEWDDSIDTTSEESHPGRLPKLPSPTRKAVSPLKKYETQKLTRRRKAKKWNVEEEDTLRAGVNKFGVGQWKVIHHAYRDIFQERTVVDLKDKWRNMMRH